MQKIKMTDLSCSYTNIFTFTNSSLSGFNAQKSFIKHTGVSMKKISLFLFSIFTCASAFAEPFSFSNFYVDGFGGINIHNSFVEDDFRIDFNTGIAVGGAVGYKFSRFFRIEGEASYRRNAFDQIVTRGEAFSVSGHAHKVTTMGNAIFEIPIFNNSLIPYIGGGMGERWDKERSTLDPIVTSEGTYYFYERIYKDQGFAWQGIAGITFGISQKIQAAIEYRYLDGSHSEGNNTIAVNLKSYF
jgi:opacity protein-like surface antigen